MTADPAGGREARFRFGDNWARFLRILDDDRIAAAERSLQEMLGCTRLDGRRFLDAGSGSGLFSLAARCLGARVHSFDYDAQSVACTEELRRRYFPHSTSWSVERGSVLDRRYLAALGEFDVVYSWGVLHHTGEMWAAMENVLPLTADGGQLFIAIYNDEGHISDRWLAVKRRYAEGGRLTQTALIAGVGGYFAVRMVDNRLRGAFARDSRSRPDADDAAIGRGMSRWYDLRDWVGGYPFEVATPEAVVDFFEQRGFSLATSRVVQGHGCNQFVFERSERRSRRGGSRA